MIQKIKNYEHYLVMKTTKIDDDQDELKEKKKDINELQRDIKDAINSLFLISRDSKRKNIEKLLARSRRAQKRDF